MRIVHVNYDARECGGASIAMLRMHRALRGIGVDSRIVCIENADDPHSEVLQRPLLFRFLKFLGKVFTKVLSGEVHSTGLIPSGMADYVNQLKPDVVMLHWLQQDTMSVREIAKFNCPVFWYFHDMWPLSGLTPHSWYPVPRSLGWLDRYCRKVKRRIVQSMGRKLIPACASKWVAEQIQNSNVFAGAAPVVIPLAIDACFKRRYRMASRRFRMLNGARGGLKAGLKGGDRLVAAFKLLPDDMKRQMELVIFGSSGESSKIEGVAVSYVGIQRGEALAQLYRDSDLFVFPSRMETFGQTKIEALSCGTPVIAFDQAACSEGIVHKRTGWVSPHDDVPDFARGIRFFFERWRDGNPFRVDSIDECYDGEFVARRICEEVSRASGDIENKELT